MFNPTQHAVCQELEEARSLYELGKESFNTDEDYESALRHFHQAVVVQESILGKYHQDTIKSYWRLSRAACMAGRDQDALKAFQRAIRMAESSFDDHINRKLWNDMESCWQEGASRSKKEASSSSALQQVAEVLSLEKKGDVASRKNNYAKAIESYQSALALQTVIMGDGSLDGADIRCKMACCCIRSVKLQEAQELLQKAHDCYVKELGEQHPATLGAIANMKSAEAMGRSATLKKKGWLSSSLSSLGSSHNSNSGSNSNNNNNSKHSS